VQGAPLQALIDQVAVAMRGLAGCRNVCVVVSGQPGQAHAALFELAREAGRTRRIDCVEDGLDASAAAAGQWHPVAPLAPGCVREAWVRDGIDEVFVLETASRADRIQVVLGFDARPGDIDAALAQAGKLAEALPVALAFEESRRQLVFQARHDPLTRLPNRLATFEAVDAAIGRAARGGRGFAVAFIDLDRFKSVNDG